MSSIDIGLFPKQLEFIRAPHREVLFDAGIGSGKSKVGTLWILLMALNYDNTRWMMAARDANQLKNATDFEFKENLRVCGLKEGVHYKRVESPQLNYKFFNGSEVMGAGAHNYDSVFRGPSLAGMLLDEADFWKRDAYTAAKGRIRKHPELIRVVTSPKGYTHIWEDFYQNADESKLVINASTYDNPTLSDAYINSLKKTYSPKLFEQEVMGRRINLTEGKVYSEFDRSKHVKQCREVLDKASAVYFFTDYNISNYCGIYMVEDEGQVYAVGEEHLKFQGTREMAKRVRNKFDNKPVYVIGDSTGNNKRDVAIEQTNYQIFRQFGLQTKPFRNPPVEQRIINADSRLFHNKIVIDPSCKSLINDLEKLSWTEDGKGIDKSDINLSHASDAWSYGVWFFMPLKKEKKSTMVRL
jgi:phage terminase large subunit